MRRAIGLTALSSVAIVSWLVASDDSCTKTPPRHWLSPLEIELRLREDGLAVQSVRSDETRCYQVIARDRSGALHAMIVSPADARVVSDIKSTAPTDIDPRAAATLARPTALD